MSYVFDTNALIRLVEEDTGSIEFSEIFVTNIGLEEFDNVRHGTTLTEDEKNKEILKREKLVQKIKKENILELDHTNIGSLKKVFGIKNGGLRFNVCKGTGQNDIVLASLAYNSPDDFKIVLNGDKKLANVLGKKLISYNEWLEIIKTDEVKMV